MLTGFTRKRFWPKGLAPFDFQPKAVDFVLARAPLPASYLAIDPGLGKTIVAAILSNRLNLKRPTKIYYVCPPFLCPNTEAEFIKWGAFQNLYVIPDTTLHKPEVQRAIRRDLKQWRETPNVRAVLIVDEAHRYANEKARRTKALFELAGRFRRVVFMSGSPLPNSRPLELWPILKRFAPEVFGTNFFAFAKKYCGAHKTDWGWKFDGFTNKKEFKARLFQSFMLRIKKSEVNLGLKEKIEGLMTVGPGLPPIVSRVERKLLAHFSPEDLVEGELTALSGKASLYLPEYLKLLGEHKLKFVLPFIQNLLAETEECIILFAHHKSVIDQLSLFLTNFEPCIISGKVPPKKRQAIVDEFQNNPKRRLFIGNIQACGIGFTLTKANRVLFIEASWRDGDNSQAADRAHRFGQKNVVTVQYVVLRDSFERRRMEVLLNKRRNAV